MTSSASNTRFILGTFGGSTGTLNINGTANFGAGAQLLLGYNGSGTVNLNAGGTLASASVIGNYNGGVAGAELFNFNGGTLKALANQTNWLQGSGGSTTTITTSSNASTIDANGFQVSMGSVIGGSGGLTITDSSAAKGGVVTLRAYPNRQFRAAP